MLYPIKVVDIELSRPLATIEGLDGYMGLQGLVRLHGEPIGYVKAPITAGCCTKKTLSELILEEHSWTIINRLLQNGLAAPPKPEGLRLEDLFDVPPPEYEGAYPLVTVAVCTRDRTDDLALCLDALCQLDYPSLDILVVDNAPTSDATEKLVETYANVRYVCEPRPGLDWARNRAIIEAKGEIIAYTDDDVVVDSGWVKALAKVFAENPEVMAVTGLVVPYELETEAQVLFEMNGGFGKGFERQWYRVGRGNKMPWWLLGTGNLGTGANMAYRHSLFEEIGGFDPALDVGTVTNGAGDLEMFFRVLKEGHTLVYEPSVLIRHRHRREYAKLHSQIINNGSAFSYFVCGAMTYPDELLSFVRLGISWLLSWHIPRLLTSFIHPTRFPQELIWAELKGCFIGLTRYHKARKNVERIVETFGSPIPQSVVSKSASPQKTSQSEAPTAVRTVELTHSIQALTDVTEYSCVRIFTTWKGSPLGSWDITNEQQPISASRLRDAIVNNLGLKLLEPDCCMSVDRRWSTAVAILNQHYASTGDEATTAASTRLPADIPVSIVVGTYDRPNDLRDCIRCLVTQDSPRRVEIIVVDNHPASGITPPVVSEFPGVVLVSESRQGVAYARNAGINVSTGEIVVSIDDDVKMPSDWLEKLIAPFIRSDVMTVTGNVLPLELETLSQRFFEKYGGLGRGFEQFEVSTSWFERSWHHIVPTWELGGTANAAFRASIFSNSEIGVMDEPLGPGMPSGVGEDIYIFYKVLKAGYTIVYEPTAFVWHKHRRDLSALRRQLYNYSKGFTSYNLTTLLRDGDFRVLANLLVYLPLYHLKRIYYRLRGWSNYPISLILLEISGNLAGPWSLWQSYRRVRKNGRSSSYIPVQERPEESEQSQQAKEMVQSTVGVNAHGN